MTQAAKKPDLRVVKSVATQDLPHDEPRELALLGAVMSDARVLDLVRDLVSPSDFYDAQRGLIFDAMASIHAAGDAVSRVTVLSWL